MTWPHDLLREIYDDPETPARIRSMLRRRLEPVEVDYRGVRMFVHPADNNTEFQIWRIGRTQEERGLRRILSYLEPPFRAFDVGANAGSFTVRLAAHGGDVTAFEPNPIMRARLERNLALNDLTVDVQDCAVSDVAGAVQLYLPKDDNFGLARIGAPFKGGRMIDVAAHPLTAFWPDNGADFLKVDVEGQEDRVIAPLLALPRARWPRMVFFEHKHNELWAEDITERLLDCGYELVSEFGRNALLRLPKV